MGCCRMGKSTPQLFEMLQNEAKSSKSERKHGSFPSPVSTKHGLAARAPVKKEAEQSAE
jgi:hypothetical protein